jgi:hypothetical protein
MSFKLGIVRGRMAGDQGKPAGRRVQAAAAGLCMAIVIAAGGCGTGKATLVNGAVVLVSVAESVAQVSFGLGLAVAIGVGVAIRVSFLVADRIWRWATYTAATHMRVGTMDSQCRSGRFSRSHRSLRRTTTAALRRASSARLHQSLQTLGGCRAGVLYRGGQFCPTRCCTRGPLLRSDSAKLGAGEPGELGTQSGQRRES